MELFRNFLKWLNDNYHIHTANCYYSYYLKYVDIFFGPRPGEELLKLMPHKRSWILQSVKRFGDYYLNRYGTIDVKQLISRIIERHQLNKNLDMKDKIYLVSPQFVSEKIDKIIAMVKDRCHLLPDFVQQASFLFKTPAEWDIDAVKPKWNEEKKKFFECFIAELSAINEWNAAFIEDGFKKMAALQQLKPGELQLPFRIMLVGGKFGPPVFNIAELLGKEEAIKRIRLLLEKL